MKRPGGRPAQTPLALAVAAALALGAAPARTQSLPVPCAGSGACGVNPANLPFLQSGAATYHQAGTAATINQTSQSAILNWQSFNIGAGHSVQFVQPNAASRALNRIWQADPSVIAGALRANGQVYLINQNGIVFANGAQVNVGGLVASALDMSDAQFLNGILSNASPASTPVFSGPPTGFVEVQAGAELRTEREGRIMLLAPRVSNNGLISTPDGQTVLAAGEKVYLTASSDPTLRGLLVEVDNPSSAVPAERPAENLALGRILAERGNVTLVGLAVNQMGRVSATTSVSRNGSIHLVARDTVTEIASPSGGINLPRGTRTGTVVLGEGSVTEVLPERASAQTITDDQTFYASKVEVLGRSIEMRGGAAIVAPGAQVSLTAQAGLEFQSGGAGPVAGARVYVDQGATIDVSGEERVAVEMARNSVAVELRGDELKDAPLLRDGPLRGKIVYVDGRSDSPTSLADVSGYLQRVPRTAAERAAVGGSIAIKSEGDIILRQGSLLDVSGGSIAYQGGFLRTTQLVSQGRLYDIGKATPDRVYDGIADSYTVSYGRWGVSETFQSTGGGYVAGYSEGRSAGTISLNAHGIALDGSLSGRATPGPYQRAPGKLPLGGQLVIGETSPVGAQPDYRVQGLQFVNAATPLPPGFDFNAAQVNGTVSVPTGVFSGGGFSRFTGTTNGTAALGAGVALDLGPGGSFSLTGGEVSLRGSVTAAGGTINLASADTFGSSLDPLAHRVMIGPAGRLDVRGRWVNDGLTGTATDPVFINGGAITATAASDLVLAPGSVLDVSGGGQRDTAGKVKAGNAGSIRLSSGRFGLGGSAQAQTSEIELGGELRGYALGKGGALNLSASRVQIGGAPTATTGELFLDPGFFSVGGFRDFTVNGVDGLQVADGTLLAPLAQTLVLGPDAATRASGSDLSAFTQRTVLPPEQRSGQQLALSANGLASGNLEVGEGALLKVDPQGGVRLSARDRLTLLGAIEAPAGTVALSLATPADGEFQASQSIWLGAESRILAGGVSRVLADNRGLRAGEVLGGGSVTINAPRGFLVAEAGARIDVSGATGTVDMTVPSGAGLAYVATPVSSDAGSINLTARQGLLFDGTMSAAPGGAGARGGALTVALDYADDLIGFPAATRVMRLQEGGGAVPAGLRPGDAIGGAVDARGVLDVAAVAAGGFDALTVKSRGRIELAGETDLSLRGSIALDAPVIAAAGPGTNRLEAAYVMLGNRDRTRQTLQAAGGGASSLEVGAQMIDLEGRLALQGYGQVTLTSSQDIRGHGIQTGLEGRDLGGTLSVGGDLTLQARQVHPTTFSAFRIESLDPTGTIRIHGNGASAPVLSAGGSLTIAAPDIVHEGALKAPFGRIVLEAARNLTLAEGSLTSVSAEGQLTPFGRTELSGIDYVYALGTPANPVTGTEEGVNSVQLSAPPEKSVRLAAPAVNIAEGARVDVSGGGDLYAYEFVPGPGGSRDILNPNLSPGSYAIVPGLASSFAPRDLQYEAGTTGLRPGDRIEFSGGGGLAAGTYTLLPARYALLPGAYLVTAKAGTTDFQAARNGATATGSVLVSGRRVSSTFDGSRAGDARSMAFEVKTGAQILREAQYADTRASAFFAGAEGVQQPGDAGRLAIAATQSLVLDGTLVAAREAGRRGAQVDLTTQRLAVVAPGGASFDSTGFLQVSAERLNALGAESLLLGGTRSATADGVDVAVGAERLVLANTAAQALSAPEVLLAATDSLTVKAGSSVVATGSAAASDLRIGSTALGVSGEGALLRVASGPQSGLSRENVNAASPARGALLVESGAGLAGRSVTLDATLSNSFQGALDLGADGALAIGANRISVDGRVGGSAIATGIVFSNSQLAALGNPGELLLRSYSTLDLFGAAELGIASLSRLTIDAAGIGGYQNAGATASIQAGTVTLQNGSGVAFSNAPALADASVPAPGTGAIALNAQTVELGKGAFGLRGFAAGATVEAAREVVATANGTLGADTGLALRSSRFTAATGADYAINLSAGVLSTARPATPATDLAPAPLGGQLRASAPTILHEGVFALPSGYLRLTATGAAGAGGAGSVTVGGDARIDVAGREQAYFDLRVPSAGGEVFLGSALAEVAIDSGARVDVSGAAGADAGRLTLSAPAGTVRFDGTLAGGAAAAGAGSVGKAAPRQGEFILDTGALGSFADLNAKLEAGGFTERRDLRVRTGEVTIDAGVTVNAHRFQLATDTGGITLEGAIDASGAKGGSVALLAGSDLVLRPGSRIDARGTESVAAAFGTRGEGGTVLLGSSSESGQVVLEAGSTIDVSGAGAARGGQVTYRASRIAAPPSLPLPTVPATAPTTTGTTNDYNLTLAGATYTPGLVLSFRAHRTSTGNTNAGTASNFIRLNVNGQGVRNVYLNDAALLGPSQIANGTTYYAVYDGSNFHLTTQAMVQSDVGRDIRLTSASGVFSGPGSQLANTLVGAASVVAEANKVYDATLIQGYGSASGADLTVTRSGVLAGMTARYMAGAAATVARLGKTGDAAFHLRPGLEVRSAGRLTVNANDADPNFLNRRGWNFGQSAWRFGGEPGVLTLRAVGDLTLASSISDGVDAIGTTNANGRLMQEWFRVQSGDAWSYRLAAGADAGAANPLATNFAGTGNFTLADNRLLRTGTGTIEVAAAGDLVLAGAGSVIYTVGTTGATVSDLAMNTNFGLAATPPPTVVGPQFPVNGGDISLRAGGAINAAASDQLVTSWLHRNGDLETDGTIAPNGGTAWWVRFDGVRQGTTAPANALVAGGFRQGVGALGGGDVAIEAGGDINRLSVSTPTNGRLGGAAGTTPDPANLVVQAGGDIGVRSGGDVNSGVFFADRGTATVVARGSVGQAADRPVATLLALGDARAEVRAGGDIALDGVFNPTVLAGGPFYRASSTGVSAPERNSSSWFFTYSADSGVDLTALGGIDLLNRAAAVKSAFGNAPAGLTGAAHAQFGITDNADAVRFYPGSLSAKALGGSLAVANDLSMYPSASGQLRLFARDAVSLPVNFAMADAAPGSLARPVAVAATFNEATNRLGVGLGASVHSDPPLHAGDTDPVLVYALTGSISGEAIGRPFQVPKLARIVAGEDVANFMLRGQNLAEGDRTLVAAARDIRYTTPRSATGTPARTGNVIEISGPGTLEVAAGRDVDLGTSAGILSRGNILANPLLPEGGAGIIVLAGAPSLARSGGLGGDPAALATFFDELRESGRAAVGTGNYDRGHAAIASLFPGSGYKGDIKLFFSQIKTEQGGDILLLAPGGLVNAGLANAGGLDKSASELGIVTVRGGSVKAFARGDFLVNQSRVFTLQGGDILIWSSEGDIDAGKGAKTASATPPPLLKVDNRGNITLDTTQSISGSGIGVLISKEGVVPGDVDLIAPRGEVNAGDAGIRAAGNLTIAAVRIVGADNIQVGGRAAGVPVAPSSAAAGSIGSTSTASTGAAQAGAEAVRGLTSQSGFRPSFITVEVIGLGS